MFYEPKDGAHDMAVDPFKSLVVPRPIGWVTSLDAEGRVNLAPFSFFNAMSEDPPTVAFSPSGRKPDRPIKDTRAISRRPRSSSAISRPGTCARR